MSFWSQDYIAVCVSVCVCVGWEGGWGGAGEFPKYQPWRFDSLHPFMIELEYWFLTKNLWNKDIQWRSIWLKVQAGCNKTMMMMMAPSLPHGWLLLWAWWDNDIFWLLQTINISNQKYRFFSTGLPLKFLSTEKLISARLGVSWMIYVNVDYPNLGFLYFNYSGGA